MTTYLATTSVGSDLVTRPYCSHDCRFMAHRRSEGDHASYVARDDTRYEFDETCALCGKFIPESHGPANQVLSPQQGHDILDPAGECDGCKAATGAGELCGPDCTCRGHAQYPGADAFGPIPGNEPEWFYDMDYDFGDPTN